MLTFQKRAVKKWTILTLFCGAHSFFWGLMIDSSILAMLLGLFTLIVMFSAIESSQTYQNKRAAKPLFAEAMDLGIKLRVFLTMLIPLCYLTISTGTARSVYAMYLLFPYTGELWIGMGANWLCTQLTGINLEPRSNHYKNSASMTGHIEHFFATYLTTIITGLIHTIILAAICGVIYAFLRLRKKPTAI